MYIFKTYLRGYYSGYIIRVKQVYNLSIWKPRGRFQQFPPTFWVFYVTAARDIVRPETRLSRRAAYIMPGDYPCYKEIKGRA